MAQIRIRGCSVQRRSWRHPAARAAWSHLFPDLGGEKLSDRTGERLGPLGLTSPVLAEARAEGVEHDAAMGPSLWCMGVLEKTAPSCQEAAPGISRDVCLKGRPALTRCRKSALGHNPQNARNGVACHPTVSRADRNRSQSYVRRRSGRKTGSRGDGPRSGSSAPRRSGPFLRAGSPPCPDRQRDPADQEPDAPERSGVHARSLRRA